MIKKLIILLMIFLGMFIYACSYDLKHITPDEKSDNRWIEIKKSNSLGSTDITRQESTSSKPVVTPPPLPNEEEWWIGMDGKQKGPFKTSKIKDLLSSGKIKYNTLIWKDGMSNWKRISDIENFKQ